MSTSTSGSTNHWKRKWTTKPFDIQFDMWMSRFNRKPGEGNMYKVPEETSEHFALKFLKMATIFSNHFGIYASDYSLESID